MRGDFVIVGGTGTLGRALIECLLPYEGVNIVVYSRDEKKQFDLSRLYSDNIDRLKFEIGDIRDKNRLSEVITKGSTVINAAALKHVPVCERSVGEAIKTNVRGVQNICDVSEKKGAAKVIQVSTDKAVDPINSYGLTKAISERIVRTRNFFGTKFCIVRYGNVLASRGSVVEIFKNNLSNKERIFVTHPEMTRFFITQPDAADTILRCVQEGQHGDIWVRRSDSIRIYDLAVQMVKAYGFPKDWVSISNIRQGEKLHETLIAKHEWKKSFEDMKEIVVIPFEPLGFSENPEFYEYSSNSIDLLAMTEINTFFTKSSLL